MIRYFYAEQYSNSQLLANRVNNLSTLQEGSTTGDAELIGIRTGYDSTNHPSAGEAVRNQVSDLHDKLDLYKNRENTIILLDNANALEKEIYNNFMYIYTYGYNLKGWKIRTVFNSEQYPYRFIFSSNDAQLSIETGGAEDYVYKDPNSERYVFIGYKWSNHVNNINYTHSNNLHLEIGDVSTVPYTLLKDIKSNIMDISQIVTINTNNITLIKSDITDFIASDMIEPDLTIENSYISNISNAGSIYVTHTSNSAFSCKIYSITKNTVYKIKAINHQLSDSYPSAVFTTAYVSQPGIVYKLENYNVIHNSTATKENVDINFSSSIDGYIIIACVSHYTSQLEIYDTIQESKINNIKNRLDILDNILTTQDTLKDKNVAVLGDSIMMLQRTGFSGTNNVSYIGSDENIYTIEELTNINGKLYVTEDTSIICEIVNSKQSDLDNQNWVSLKNSLGAASLMNLGLGGGTVREKRIITEYPYPDGGSGTNCLSNEVKMLKRLVNSGKPIPDCILIWIGTNDASVAFGNDNNADRNFDFDTVMGMDYDVLADDTLGRDCRSSFYGGLRYSLETLCREFPHATIFIFTPFQTNLSNHRTYERLSTVGNALIKMGKRYSCICVDSLNEIGIVDLLETSLGSGPFLYDGLHPNPTGKRLLTNYATSRLTSLYFLKN